MTVPTAATQARVTAVCVTVRNESDPGVFVDEALDGLIVWVGEPRDCEDCATSTTSYLLTVDDFGCDIASCLPCTSGAIEAGSITTIRCPSEAAATTTGRTA